MVHNTGQTCVCGHGREPHEHYRRGSDCSLCPPLACRRFRPASGLAQTLRRLLAGTTSGRRDAERG